MVSVMSLLSLGTSFICLGNMRHWQLLYFLEAVIQLVRVNITLTSNVAVTRCFEKVTHIVLKTTNGQ